MKLYVLIDPQNDFITGVFGSPEAKKAADNIAIFLSEMKNETIFITQDVHDDYYIDGREGKKLPKHCMLTDKNYLSAEAIGYDIYDPIATAITTYHQGHERIFTKSTFGSVDLFAAISKLSKQVVIDEVIVMGFCSDICVMSNILPIASILPSAEITFMSNLSAGSSPENHEAAIKVMKANLINVI